MTESEPLATRLAEVEIEMTYQRETIDTLNKTITEQWQKIDGLLADMRRLKDQIQSLEARAPQEGVEPPPPHY